MLGKSVLVAVVLLLFWAAPVMGDFEIHGQISVEYDRAIFYNEYYWPYGDEFYIWSLELWVPLGDNWRIGARTDCNTVGFVSYDDWLPKPIPTGQYYELFISWRPVDWIELRLSDRCRHVFDQALIALDTPFDVTGYSIKATVLF